jgi:hypothetical protein
LEERQLEQVIINMGVRLDYHFGEDRELIWVVIEIGGDFLELQVVRVCIGFKREDLVQEDVRNGGVSQKDKYKDQDSILFFHYNRLKKLT